MLELYNGDCLDVMDKLIEQGVKVDAIITDPPYKITSRGNGGNSGGMFQDKNVNSGKVFKHNEITFKEWIPKAYSILKESGHFYCMTNDKNLLECMTEIKNAGFMIIKTLIWVKDNKIMSQAYMTQKEYIIFARKGKFVKINNCGTSDVLLIPNKKSKGISGKNLHDTEKPIELNQILMENSTSEGDTVLDPFMGIGSCGVACSNTNRKFIGIELDENYFNIAKERIGESEQEEVTPYDR